jgi:hypothetical protein
LMSGPISQFEATIVADDARSVLGVDGVGGVGVGPGLTTGAGVPVVGVGALGGAVAEPPFPPPLPQQESDKSAMLNPTSGAGKLFPTPPRELRFHMKQTVESRWHVF